MSRNVNFTLCFTYILLNFSVHLQFNRIDLSFSGVSFLLSWLLNYFLLNRILMGFFCLDIQVSWIYDIFFRVHAVLKTTNFWSTVCITHKYIWKENNFYAFKTKTIVVLFQFYYFVLFYIHLLRLRENEINKWNR